MESFAKMLTGGHPNSLGRTIEVVDITLADQARLAELYQCYFESDAVVRLRTSSAFKRVCKAQPEWLVPYIDRFITEISQLDQASAQWTLAELYSDLESYMSQEQRQQAKAVLRHNLVHNDDWIVLNRTRQTLSEWAATDSELHAWLEPQLRRLGNDSRKSVAKRAKKLIEAMYEI